MKQLVIFLIILLAILALVFMKPAPKKAAPSKPSAPASTEQTVHHAPSPEELVNAAPKPEPPKAQPERQRPAEAATSVASEVNSVINYGMGATQLKAKKNAVQKIRSIENKHNQDLDKALK